MRYHSLYGVISLHEIDILRLNYICFYKTVALEKEDKEEKEEEAKMNKKKKNSLVD